MRTHPSTPIHFVSSLGQSMTNLPSKHSPKSRVFFCSCETKSRINVPPAGPPAGPSHQPGEAGRGRGSRLRRDRFRIRRNSALDGCSVLASYIARPHPVLAGPSPIPVYRLHKYQIPGTRCLIPVPGTRYTKGIGCVILL